MAGNRMLCTTCKDKLYKTISSVCGCKEVSLKTVIDAVKHGADTAEKVSEVTGEDRGSRIFSKIICSVK